MVLSLTELEISGDICNGRSLMKSRAERRKLSRNRKSKHVINGL